MVQAARGGLQDRLGAGGVPADQLVEDHRAQRPVEPAWRPFCSERCKLMDLGAWASERHAIPGEAVETEDADMMGEFLDSLRAFGLEDTHPLIRTGAEVCTVEAVFEGGDLKK